MLNNCLLYFFHCREPTTLEYHQKITPHIMFVIATVQQALRVKWCVFGVFVCFVVNYRSWQAEILQERAEGCIQVDLQKKIRQT